MAKITIYRVDPRENIYRFYCLGIQPNLFGQWCFVKEWGRIGYTGQVRDVPYQTLTEAEAALERQQRKKLRRDYRPLPATEIDSKISLRLSRVEYILNIAGAWSRKQINEQIDVMTVQATPRGKTAQRLILEKDHMDSMEDILFDEEFRTSASSSVARIRLAQNKREALLNERVIDVFTESLGFGICTFILHMAGIVTVRDLISRTECELTDIPNIGPKKIASIKAELADCGLSLRPTSLPASQLQLTL